MVSLLVSFVSLQQNIHHRLLTWVYLAHNFGGSRTKQHLTGSMARAAPYLRNLIVPRKMEAQAWETGGLAYYKSYNNPQENSEGLSTIFLEYNSNYWRTTHYAPSLKGFTTTQYPVDQAPNHSGLLWSNETVSQTGLRAGDIAQLHSVCLASVRPSSKASTKTKGGVSNFPVPREITI